MPASILAIAVHPCAKRIIGLLLHKVAVAMAIVAFGSGMPSMADVADMADVSPPGDGPSFTAQGRAAHRRLDRREYENTLRDLLDLPGLSVQDMLPEDGRAYGFDKSGEALELSHVHIAGYAEAARTALAMVSATQANPMKPLQHRLLPGEQDFFKLALIEGDAVFLKGGQYDSAAMPLIREALPHPLPHYEKTGLFPYRHSVGVFRRQGANDHFALFFNAFTPTYSGRYRLRLSLWSFQWVKGSLQARDAPEVASLHANDRLLGYYDAPSLAPRVHEIDTWLNAGERLVFTAASLPPVRVYQREGRAAEYVGPGIAIDSMDIEGPLHESWPPASHRRIFGNLPVRSEGATPSTHAKHVITGFLSRAFRRPATATEVATYTAMVGRRVKQGDSFEAAIKTALQGALCSPEFLFLTPRPGPLDDWSLAARLSYFLWDSMPDEELFTLASRQHLRRPDVLHAQVDRMLADPKSQRFIDHFLDEWLDLREIDLTTPDSALYPEYSQYLRDSMLAETRAFFRELIQHNAGIKSLVDSDFIMVNQKLAEHYQLAQQPPTGSPVDGGDSGRIITQVQGSQVRRVPLPEGSCRGGLLTQASVLKVTSNGTVTSPVKRGAWVLREILGQPPEPPPPNIPAIDPDRRGAVTIREQLAMHTNDTSCATCHAAIDPPGFALENFDVIGGWRDRYRSVADDRTAPESFSDGPFVDASCCLEDGRHCRTINDFKQALQADQKLLARNFARQLLVYATGADIQAADRDELDAIVNRAAPHEYGIRSLIHETVASRCFLEK